MNLGRGTLWAKRASTASVLLLLTLARAAGAQCIPPDPLLLWSYPDQSTEQVPVNAHFWALVPFYVDEQLTVALDGEPVSRVVPVGDERVAPIQPGAPMRRAEYAPSAPLEPGEHELTITIDSSDYAPARETYRFTFIAREQEVRASEVEIAAVTEYRGNDRVEGEFLSAAQQCEGQLLDTRDPCYDTGYPNARTRIQLEHDANAVAYLVGDRLVPASCDDFYLVGLAPEELAVTAVLPSGLSEARSFAGDVERIGGESDAGCALARRPRGSSSLLALGLLASAALWRMRRRTSSFRSRHGALALGAGISALVVGWVSSAAANCGRDPSVLWTYPDATTSVVPETTSLWVLLSRFSEDYARVTLDGERIRRVNATGSTPLERAEYAPNEALAPGEHELVIEVNEPGTDAVELHIPFVAGAASMREARSQIASITRYEWPGPDPIGASSVEPFPPEAAYQGDCTDRLVDTSEGCYDTGPGLLYTRVELDSNGEAIANLVGDLLVPGDCRVFFPFGFRAYRGEYPLTPVLPEGALSERSFEGEIEVLEGHSTVFDDQGPSGWCSLGSVGSRTSAAVLFVALGLGVVTVSRRRARSSR